MSLLQEGDLNSRLVIPDGLVFYPERWKVLDTLVATCTVFGQPDETLPLMERIENTPTWTEERELALILPSEPGTGGLTTGFTMKLVMITPEKTLSSKGASSVGLHFQGIDGFVTDTLMMFYVDKYNDPRHAEYQDGYRGRILALRNVVDEYRGILTQDAHPSLQTEWEAAAQAIAPYLAPFFDLRREEQIAINYQY